MRPVLGVLALLTIVVAVSILAAGCPQGPKPPTGSEVTPGQTEPDTVVAPEGAAKTEEGAEGATEEGAKAAEGEATEEGATDEKAEETTEEGATTEKAEDEAEPKAEEKGTE